LRNKFGEQADTILTERRLAEANRHFDTVIKRQYNPYDENCEAEFEIPLNGAPDLPDVGLEEGYLALSKYVSMRSMLISGMIFKQFLAPCL
jgi:hypothetical protein